MKRAAYQNEVAEAKHIHDKVIGIGRVALKPEAVPPKPI